MEWIIIYLYKVDIYIYMYIYNFVINPSWPDVAYMRRKNQLPFSFCNNGFHIPLFLLYPQGEN